MEQGELLLLLALHLVLTGLPGAAAVIFAAGRGERREPVLLSVGLAVSGATAMLAFWAYYWSQALGDAFSFLLIAAAVVLIVWSLVGGKVDRPLLRRLAVPVALWALGSAFLVFFGFLHGGTGAPLGTAATRFSGQLPSDNDIPLFFSEWFFHNGHHGTPAVFPGEWLASDRPPLQVGYLLAQQRFAHGTAELNYQVLGVVLQQLWIVGLWALLGAARVGRVTKGLAMLTVLVSDVAIVNGFFVWPKLLPAAMLLAAAALLITPLWSELRSRTWAGALVAVLFGLALMGHGSSVFGVIPLALIAAWRGMPSWRWLGVAVLCGAIVVVPWSAYQKWGDPPGNRLTKWMLGGVGKVDSRGTVETIRDSYEEVGVGGALGAKGQNFLAMAGAGPVAHTTGRMFEALGSLELGRFVRKLRELMFFSLLPSLGLLLIVPVMMALRRRRQVIEGPDWDLSLMCWLVFVVGAVIWGLLLFGEAAPTSPPPQFAPPAGFVQVYSDLAFGARAVVHQGSYLIPIFGFVGAVAGLRACFPRFAVWYVGIAAALMLIIYVPDFLPPRGGGFSVLSALLALASLAGFGLLAFGRDAGARLRVLLTPRVREAV